MLLRRPQLRLREIIGAVCEIAPISHKVSSIICQVSSIICARYAAKLINSSLLIAYGHTPMPPRGAKCDVIVGVRSSWRGTPGTYIQSYRSRFPGARGERISTKAERRNCEVVIQHRSFAVKRLPTTTTTTMTTAGGGALSEEDLW